jgi:ADP-ribose pyrophosphatase YjhB (NUDIX family)
MSERTLAQSLLLRGVLHPFWRLQRGVTLGAQGIVLDALGQVLLVKHSYKLGWCFPGGGVEHGEPVLTALTRELDEECGVILERTPDLFGVYSNHRYFRNDHIVLYLVGSYTRPRIPQPNREIVAQAYFPAWPPPDGCAPATARRLKELFDGAPRDPYW